MRVGLQHLDPKIAAEIQRRLCAPSESFLLDNIQWDSNEPAAPTKLFGSGANGRRPRRKPALVERAAAALRDKREAMTRGRLIAALVGVPLSAVATYYIVAMAEMPAVTYSLTALVLLVTTLVGWNRVRKVSAEYELRFDLTVDEWHSVLPLLTLDPVEQAYCELIRSAAERDPNQEGRRAIRRDLLLICDLMAEYRRMERIAALHTAGNMPARTAEWLQSATEEFRTALIAIREAHEKILVAPSAESDAATRLIVSTAESATKRVDLLERALTVQPSAKPRSGRGNKRGSGRSTKESKA